MKILIGTNNKSKVSKWSRCFEDIETLCPADLNLNIQIKEGFDSLKKNSLKKAKSFARASNILTLGDDTGFFIKELGGQPGVAAKRWRRNFSDRTSSKEWKNHLRKKLSKFSLGNAYFETFVTLTDDRNFCKTFNEKLTGKISFDRLNSRKERKEDRLILEDEFIFDKTGKSWKEMNDKEKSNLYSNLNKPINRSVRRYYLNKKIVLTGPRSIGKTTISFLLAKKLGLPRFSSDEIMEKVTQNAGGLDKTIKNKGLGKFMGEAIKKVRFVLSKDDFVFDLAGGAVTSLKFKESSKKIRESVKENSIVIGLLPYEVFDRSFNMLSNREIARKHFRDIKKKEVVKKVYSDLKKYYDKDFLDFCDVIIYTGDKKSNEIVKEICKIGEENKNY